MEGIEHLMENQAFSKRAGSHQEGYVRYGSSYGSGYENICGAPQIVYVPQGRMSESEAGGPATGNVPVLLLLGLYGLLAVFTLARLLTANLTAFQVLQGDPAVTAGKRFRRDLAVGRESFNPGQISKLITAISMTKDREHIERAAMPNMTSPGIIGRLQCPHRAGIRSLNFHCQDALLRRCLHFQKNTEVMYLIVCQSMGFMKARDATLETLLTVLAL